MGREGNYQVLVWKLGSGQAWERREKSPVSLPSSRVCLPHGLQQQDRFAPSAPRGMGWGSPWGCVLSEAAGRTWVNIFIKLKKNFFSPSFLRAYPPTITFTIFTICLCISGYLSFKQREHVRERVGGCRMHLPSSLVGKWNKLEEGHVSSAQRLPCLRYFYIFYDSKFDNF